MIDKVFQPAIKITSARDVDDLNRVFFEVLVDMLPIHSVSLIQQLDDGSDEQFEALARLEVSDSGVAKMKGADELNEVISVEGELANCLHGSEVTQQQLAGEFVLNLPLIELDSCLGAVILGGSNELATKVKLAKSLIQIYGNCLAILNESERDKLTGLLNRRTFDKKLAQLLKQQALKIEQIARAGLYSGRRNDRPNSTSWLVVIDIDHFKRINDDFGHIYGDEVLLTLSHKMKSFFRNSDLLFRFGGEEFVVILGNAPLEGAWGALERFRKTIAGYSFPQIGQMTISAGFARIRDGDYPWHIFEQADKALYHAKGSGRNSVHCYETLQQVGILKEQNRSGSVDLFVDK